MMLLGSAFQNGPVFLGGGVGEEFEKVYMWVDRQTTDQILIETSCQLPGQVSPKGNNEGISSNRYIFQFFFKKLIQSLR